MKLYATPARSTHPHTQASKTPKNKMASPDVQPNRWNTPIVVKQYLNNRVIDTMHHGDLQEAYYDVKKYMRTLPNEHFSDLPSFQQFARDMDEIWAEQMTGVVLTESDHIRFDVYYNVNGMYSRNDDDEEEEEDAEMPGLDQGEPSVYIPPVVYVPAPNVPPLNLEAIARALEAMQTANSER